MTRVCTLASLRSASVRKLRASHAVPEIARTNLVRFLHQHSSRIGGKLTTKSDTAGHRDKIRCFCNKLATLGYFWRHTGTKKILLARKSDTSMSARTYPRGWPLAFATTAAHIPAGIPEYGTRYNRGLRSGVGHRTCSPWAANPAVDVGPSFCRRVPHLGAPAVAPDPTRSCASSSHMHPFPGKGGH